MITRLPGFAVVYRKKRIIYTLFKYVIFVKKNFLEELEITKISFDKRTTNLSSIIVKHLKDGRNEDKFFDALIVIFTFSLSYCERKRINEKE